MEDFIKAYLELPFVGVLVDINTEDKFSISGQDIYWQDLGDGDWNYNGWITEGEQRYDGWLMVNLDIQTGTWITIFFKEENEVHEY